MMISFARAGPTSRTKRVVDATPSGTPRSTSGIQNSASAAAQRKSQARLSPQPPPTACPLIRAIVACSRLSRSVVARSKRRRNCVSLWRNARRRSSGDIVERSGASAPAEKTGGAPVTTTTRISASSLSSVSVAASSVNIASLNEFRRSGRFSMTVATRPSRTSATWSPMTRGRYHRARDARNGPGLPGALCVRPTTATRGKETPRDDLPGLTGRASFSEVETEGGGRPREPARRLEIFAGSQSPMTSPPSTLTAWPVM